MKALANWREMVRLDDVGRHVLVASPEQADRIVFIDLAQHAMNPFLMNLFHHPFVAEFPDKILVYDERDRPTYTFPGIYVGASTARRRAGAVAGGPYTSLYTNVHMQETEPHLLWSFAGSRTHPLRDVILGLEDERAVTRDTTALSIFSSQSHPNPRIVVAQQEYNDLLAQSRFVLCPRGHGPSSYRLFETLAAGRVPVILSDRWVPPPRINWESCSVQLPESQVAQIPEALRKLDSTWSDLASEARNVWQEHFQPARMWDHLAESFEYLQAGRRTRRPWWAQRDVSRLWLGLARARLRP